MDNNKVSLSQVIRSVSIELEKHIAYNCLNQLKSFNKCRSTGIKDKENLNSVSSKEASHFDVTRGCYEEYQLYYNCMHKFTEQLVESKEAARFFEEVPKEKFVQALEYNYKLI